MVDLLLTMPKNITTYFIICKHIARVIINVVMKSPILRVTLFCFGAVIFAAAVGYGSVKLFVQLQS